MIIATPQVCVCWSSCNTRLELSMHQNLSLWSFASLGSTLSEMALLSSVLSFPWADPLPLLYTWYHLYVKLGRAFMQDAPKYFFFPFFFLSSANCPAPPDFISLSSYLHNWQALFLVNLLFSVALLDSWLFSLCSSTLVRVCGWGFLLFLLSCFCVLHFTLFSASWLAPGWLPVVLSSEFFSLVVDLPFIFFKRVPCHVNLSLPDLEVDFQFSPLLFFCLFCIVFSFMQHLFLFLSSLRLAYPFFLAITSSSPA